MIYIFQNSNKQTVFADERTAREILDQKAGYRIKYDYLGATDDTEYTQKRNKAIIEANEKFIVINQNEDTIIEKRKYLDGIMEELDNELISKADKNIQPRKFKVMKLAMGESDKVEEETNPVFRGMIR